MYNNNFRHRLEPSSMSAVIILREIPRREKDNVIALVV